MVTTRDLEHTLEETLIEAGAPEDQARQVGEVLGDHLVNMATKQDVDDAVRVAQEQINERIDAVNHRIDSLERTMWRLAWLGFAMWSATFGALMYAVFG